MPSAHNYYMEGHHQSLVINGLFAVMGLQETSGGCHLREAFSPAPLIYAGPIRNHHRNNER